MNGFSEPALTLCVCRKQGCSVFYFCRRHVLSSKHVYYLTAMWRSDWSVVVFDRWGSAKLSFLCSSVSSQNSFCPLIIDTSQHLQPLAITVDYKSFTMMNKWNNTAYSPLSDYFHLPECMVVYRWCCWHQQLGGDFWVVICHMCGAFIHYPLKSISVAVTCGFREQSCSKHPPTCFDVGVGLHFPWVVT